MFALNLVEGLRGLLCVGFGFSLCDCEGVADCARLGVCCVFKMSVNAPRNTSLERSFGTVRLPLRSMTSRMS